MRQLKIWFFLAVICFLAYGAIFFLQRQGSVEAARSLFLERQMWLARQCARFLEDEMDAGALPAEALTKLRVNGRVKASAASRFGLFDNLRRQFILIPEIPEDAEEAWTKDHAVRRCLERGGHGSLANSLAGEDILMTYLPLRTKGQVFSLVLVAREQAVVAPLSSNSLSQLALPLLLLPALTALILQRPKQKKKILEKEPDREALNREMQELQSHIDTLSQENALLGMARREYQLLIEGSGYGVARLNTNGNLMFCSVSFLKLTGFERKKLLGRNVLDLDLFDSCARGELQQAMATVRQGGAATAVLAQISGIKTGSDTVEALLSPLRIDEENTGMILFLRPHTAAENSFCLSLS